MTLLEVVVLAVVQGVSEFLPISSSGHLVIVAEFLGRGASVDLNIVLHAGTLLSILVFFWRRVARLLTEDPRMIWLIAVGTIPAAALGLLIRYRFRGALESPLLTGFMLIVTGLMLLASDRLEGRKGRDSELSVRASFSIGLFQALALLPGISRSGATIFGGMLSGLTQHSAATFSFLLAIPAIAGASVLELRDLLVAGNGSVPNSYLAVGCAVAFAVGLASLAWLFRWIEVGKLHLFAYWCIPLGIAVVVWQVIA
jgi:undecaprenyl-diphosphatase